MRVASFPQDGSGPYDQLKGKDKILFDKIVVGIVNSKKIVVVAGAGMSCSSGIPVSLFFGGCERYGPIAKLGLMDGRKRFYSLDRTFDRETACTRSSPR